MQPDNGRGCGKMPDQHASDGAALLAELTDIARSVFEDPGLELAAATTCDDVPAWDSLNHITLVVEVECRFGIKFAIDEVEDIKSVGTLARLIESKLAVVHA